MISLKDYLDKIKSMTEIYAQANSEYKNINVAGQEVIDQVILFDGVLLSNSRFLENTFLNNSNNISCRIRYIDNLSNRTDTLQTKMSKYSFKLKSNASNGQPVLFKDKYIYFNGSNKDFVSNYIFNGLYNCTILISARIYMTNEIFSSSNIDDVYLFYFDSITGSPEGTGSTFPCYLKTNFKNKWNQMEFYNGSYIHFEIDCQNDFILCINLNNYFSIANTVDIIYNYTLKVSNAHNSNQETNPGLSGKLYLNKNTNNNSSNSMVEWGLKSFLIYNNNLSCSDCIQLMKGINYEDFFREGKVLRKGLELKSMLGFDFGKDELIKLNNRDIFVSIKDNSSSSGYSMFLDNISTNQNDVIYVNNLQVGTNTVRLIGTGTVSLRNNLYSNLLVEPFCIEIVLKVNTLPNTDNSMFFQISSSTSDQRSIKVAMNKNGSFHVYRSVKGASEEFSTNLACPLNVFFSLKLKFSLENNYLHGIKVFKSCECAVSTNSDRLGIDEECFTFKNESGEEQVVNMYDSFRINSINNLNFEISKISFYNIY